MKLTKLLPGKYDCAESLDIYPKMWACTQKYSQCHKILHCQSLTLLTFKSNLYPEYNILYLIITTICPIWGNSEIKQPLWSLYSQLIILRIFPCKISNVRSITKLFLPAKNHDTHFEHDSNHGWLEHILPFYSTWAN